MRQIIILGVMLYVALFANLVFAGKVNVKKLAAQTWISIESERFAVTSNASEAKTLSVLQELENFTYFIAEVMQFGEPQLVKKIPIIMVDNESTFRALGMPRNYVGIFLGRDGGVVFARADRFRSAESGRNWGRLVVLHELSHLLLNSASNGLISSPWFNEGIAEYLGTFQIKNNHIYIGELAALSSGFYSLETRAGRYQSVDTESLFKVTQAQLRIGQKYSREQYLFVNKFYARSSAVVHYLDAEPERRKKMYAYLHLVDSGVDIDDAFYQIFNMEYQDLDVKVDRYVRRKMLKPRMFEMGIGGVQFPRMTVSRIDASQRAAILTIYSKLSLFDDNFLGKGVRDKMKGDFEKYFPGILDP